MSGKYSISSTTSNYSISSDASNYSISESSAYDIMVADGNEFDNGKLVMTWDDGWDSWYTDGLSIYAAQGVKFTGFINASTIGSGARLTLEQVKECISAGHDIQCHGNTGGKLETLSDADILSEYVDNNSWFAENDIQSPKHTAYSAGSYTQNAIDILDEYRLTARTTKSGFTNRKSSKYELKGISINNDSDIDQIKIYLDYAKANKLAMITIGHSMKEELVYTELDNTAAYLNELIDYAQSIGLDIITMSQLYDQMLYIDLRLSREGLADDEMDITFKHALASSYSVSIERSDDGGDTYTEIIETAAGVTYYQDTGLTINTNYYYRVRAVKNGVYLPYSREASMSTPITMVATSTGTGAGVAIFTLSSNQNITITIDGAGKFYSDAAGTLNEATSWLLPMGVVTIIYVKVTSGASNIIFPFNDLHFIETWSGTTNVPSLSFDVSKFPTLAKLSIYGNNTLYGSVEKLVNLTRLDLAGGAVCSGDISILVNLKILQLSAPGLTCTLDITNLINLTQLDIRSDIDPTGSIDNLVNLERLIFTLDNTITGSITGKPLTYLQVFGQNTLSGEISGLTTATLIYVTGLNTIDGADSVAGLTSCTLLIVTGQNRLAFDLATIPSSVTNFNINPSAITTYTQGHDWSHITASWDIRPAAGYGLSATEVDNLLIDMSSSGMDTNAYIYIKGSCEPRTSASDAAVTALELAGMTVDTN